MTRCTPPASGQTMSAICHSFECSPPDLQRLISLTPHVKSRSDTLGADRTHAARVRSVHHRVPPTSNWMRRCPRQPRVRLIPVSPPRRFFMIGRSTEFGHHLTAKSVTSALALVYVNTTGRTSVESGHNLLLASGHMAEVTPSLEHTTERVGLAEASVRSLFHSDKHLLHFINFSTLAQMCQPPCVSPCARVLAHFHKHF
jgi:DNA-binding Xre family transcriptional regulator